MKDFKTSEGVQRVVEFMDKLARKAWEPFHKDEDGFPKNTPANQQYYDYQQNLITPLWEVLAKSSGSFSAALRRNDNILPHQSTPSTAPHGYNIAEEGSNWRMFEFDKIIEIIKSNSISSVADATVKTTAYLKTIAGSMGHGEKRFLFRGQSNIDHELIPRLGRLIREGVNNGKTSEPSDPLVVTDIEKQNLEDFQKNWDGIDRDEIDEIIYKNNDLNDYSWWVLMQHYADGFGDGTRLLDVTSSLLFALLFACIKWESGLVDDADDSSDGIIYFFVEGQNCRVVDYATSSCPAADSAFNTEVDISYMVFNPPHNERSKAQSGGFIWWPKFWTPLTHNLPYLRIPKEHKRDIVKELLALGVGPKEAVRGSKGQANEKALRDSI